MRPLRITHTESSLGWGGQEIRILSESQGLMRRGHDVKLLCAPQARIRVEAANWGVPALPLPIDRKRLVGLGALIHWFGANASDIINTHSSTDSWLAACAQVAIGSPTRIVRTRHISARVPRNLLSRWLYQRATAYVVTTGEALKRELVERNRFSASRIESVPTGIDAGRFRPGERKAMRAKFGLPQDKTLAGIVATLRSWKGHLVLLEAMTRLPEHIELVIVGDGPMREDLEKRIVQLGLRGRVRMQGQQADVLPWLRALDIFVLPSYANEGVPQALVQAMLVELPCVTTAVGGIPEVAEHERTALLVPPNDAAALGVAIERLAGNEGLRRELGEAARKHCVEGYSYERMLDRMETLYRSVSGVY
jgi:glycosyltransferase involved in cell wall biosynthesis